MDDHKSKSKTQAIAKTPSKVIVIKKKVIVIPTGSKSRPERVKILLEALSPKTKSALALKTIEDLQSRSENPSGPVYLEGLDGVSVPVVIGEQAKNQLENPSGPVYLEGLDGVSVPVFIGKQAKNLGKQAENQFNN